MAVHPRRPRSSSPVCVRHFVRNTTRNLMIPRLETGRDESLINVTVIWRLLQIKPSALICLWLYSPLLDLGRFFSFLILHTVGRTPWTGDQPVARPQSVRLLGRGISLSQGRYLHTEQHKHRINVHRHPCLEWCSNPRF
jgi:hypothetical protein